MAPGSYAPNLHEGSRSEYLAQYIFSTFGTSLPVLHQEDYGVDLHCTISERKGQRAWPVAYYSVQIKSTDEPWQFEGRESVQWLVDYPAPLLYCIVNKESAQIRVYQTMARLGGAVMSQLPDNVALIPGSEGEGHVEMAGDGAGNFQLGAPILQFNVAELMDDVQFEQFRKVLYFWVLNDLDNCSATPNRYAISFGAATVPNERGPGRW